MKIPLDDIKACSQCPAYFQYLKEGVQKPVSKQVAVALQVIQRAYVQCTETSYKMHWRTILEHVDSFIFKDVDPTNPDQYKAARQASEYVLVFLRNWYNTYYLPEQMIGYADIPLEQHTGRHLVHDTAPIIVLSEHPILVYVDDIEQEDIQMYNDIKVRGLLWLASEALGCDIIEARHFTMKPMGGFAANSIKVSRESNHRVKSAITQVCSLIAGGADYPSATEKCINCPFIRRCIL